MNKVSIRLDDSRGDYIRRRQVFVKFEDAPCWSVEATVCVMDSVWYADLTLWYDDPEHGAGVYDCAFVTSDRRGSSDTWSTAIGRVSLELREKLLCHKTDRSHDAYMYIRLLNELDAFVVRGR